MGLRTPLFFLLAALLLVEASATASLRSRQLHPPHHHDSGGSSSSGGGSSSGGSSSGGSSSGGSSGGGSSSASSPHPPKGKKHNYCKACLIPWHMAESGSGSLSEEEIFAALVGFFGVASAAMVGAAIFAVLKRSKKRKVAPPGKALHTTWETGETELHHFQSAPSSNYVTYVERSDSEDAIHTMEPLDNGKMLGKLYRMGPHGGIYDIRRHNTDSSTDEDDIFFKDEEGAPTGYVAPVVGRDDANDTTPVVIRHDDKTAAAPATQQDGTVQSLSPWNAVYDRLGLKH